MVHPRLKRICEYIDSWCKANRIAYDVVCDESDLQGIMLFRKDRMAESLQGDLTRALADTGVHLETKKVRGGTIFALSLTSIAEKRMQAFEEEFGPMTFSDKIAEAFYTTVSVEGKDEEPQITEATFLQSALKIAKEEQHQPTNRITPTEGYMQKIVGGEVLGRPEFSRRLDETLQGMATPSGVQPGDLFSKFSDALNIMGKTMGGISVQDQLKQRGINWENEPDGQAVQLYVINGTTNAKQPVGRISAATLEKPADFEMQLLNILDFAKGDAPGTFKQKQEEMKMQQQAASDIAKKFGPQDPNSVEAQAAQVAGAPKAAAPPQPAQPAAAPQPAPAPAPAQPAKPAATPGLQPAAAKPQAKPAPAKPAAPRTPMR
jgi:hypothetical protein